MSLAVILFGKRIHDRFEVIQKMFSDISSRVQENLSGVRVIRAYAQENAEMRKFELLNQDYVGAKHPAGPAFRRCSCRCCKALIGLGFLIVLAGRRLPVAGASHFARQLRDVQHLHGHAGLAHDRARLGGESDAARDGFVEPNHGADAREARHRRRRIQGSSRKLKEVAGALRFEDVEVKYPAGVALKNVDLEIPAGATVAIVGHTGSGKSTLVSLIPRLIDPTRGRVLLDGVDLRDLDPEWLRRQIGFVPQETFLFSATLAENIAWGVEGATEDDIARAAELAGLAPDIASFPAGYQTMIGERGLTLSGGQKQRVAIARAILRDPRILILDDALSSVDTLTEERILTGLAASDARPHHDSDLAPRFHRPERRPDLCDRARRGGRAGHPRRVGRERRLLRGPVSEAVAGRGAGGDLVLPSCDRKGVGALKLVRTSGLAGSYQQPRCDLCSKPYSKCR